MYQMMQAMQGLGYGMSGLSLVFWITTILVWAVLTLLIAYLWSKIKK